MPSMDSGPCRTRCRGLGRNSVHRPMLRQPRGAPRSVASRSLISDSSFTPAGISGALGTSTFASSCRFSLFIARITKKSTQATMMKLRAEVMN